MATGSYSFDYEALADPGRCPRHTQVWLFLAFALAFAIKVPLFPFHTWLPDAHVEAPTAGSVILAGVLLKMGTYGLLRFAFPLFPDAAVYFAPCLAVLAVIGIVYGALVAMVQPDMKKLVAYSSVSHLGFVVLGIASMNVQGVQGAVYQMLNHGVSHRRAVPHRRHDLRAAAHAPDRGLRRAEARRCRLVAAFFVITLSSIGLPGPERLRRRVPDPARGVPVEPARCAAVAATGVILSAVYMLWMFQRVIYGAVTNPKNEGMQRPDTREKFVLWPLIVMAVFMGVAPWGSSSR